jgi:hypothetical protein
MLVFLVRILLDLALQSLLYPPPDLTVKNNLAMRLNNPRNTTYGTNARQRSRKQQFQGVNEPNRDELVHAVQQDSDEEERPRSPPPLVK